MVFSSIQFVVFFLPAFLFVYLLAGRKYKNLVFLFFSVVFYAWGAPRFILILVGSTLLNFYLVKELYYARTRKLKRLLGFFSILVNLGLLAYFKYANFFVENLNAVLANIGFETYHWTAVILPIGISFFTFQSLTYTIDVYRGIHAPLKNPLNYMLYIMMFPQLVAGPIVRYETIADQLTTRKASNEDFLTGFYRFVIGLSKKVLIADVLGREVFHVMQGDVALLDSTTAWIAILAYAFQIYFDFAGYSDMAIGIGRMLGFRFPENFDNPYTAASVTEFWRRWHMTFTTFMRLYLYYPLGGNRVKTKRRLYFNLFTVFLISGLWHGASWNFVVWGALHGMLLVTERVFLKNVLDRLPKFIGVLYTFIAVILVWVPFRLENFSDSLAYFSRLFAFDFGPLHWEAKNYIYVTLLIAFLFSMITLSKTGKRLQEILYKDGLRNREHLVYFALSSAFLVFCIASLAGWGFSPFIYFRF
jgi:alginate O-acetyltransferase complex protein AlgI